MDRCDGWCGEYSTEEECRPPTVPVKIVGGRWDGAEFDYCQNAIEKDRANGFTVVRAAPPTGEEDGDE